MIDANEWASLREDVGYIRAKIEVVENIGVDHEDRLRKMERRWWQFPITALLAITATIFGHPFPPSN